MFCSHFKEHIGSFLKHSYNLDAINSPRHLCRPSQILQKTSCLDMANSIGCPHFISHDSVQDLVGQIWTGSIADNVSIFQVFLALFFPPYLLRIRFHKKGQYMEFETEEPEGEQVEEEK